MKPAAPVPAEALRAYDALLARHPGLVRKGAALPYTSRNGHMASFLTESGALALRLAPEDLAAALAKGGARPCVRFGKPLKEYAEWPLARWSASRTIRRWLERSLAHVDGLEPKAAAPPRTARKRRAR